MICLLCYCDLVEESAKALRHCEPSLWTSLCKILEATADESFMKIFRNCHLCQGCYIIVEQSNVAIMKLEEIEREISSLKCQLKSCLERSLVTQLTAGPEDIHRDCADHVRTVLTKHLDRVPDHQEEVEIPTIPNSISDDDDNSAHEAHEESVKEEYRYPNNRDKVTTVDSGTLADISDSPESQNAETISSSRSSSSQSVPSTLIVVRRDVSDNQRLSNQTITTVIEKKVEAAPVTNSSNNNCDLDSRKRRADPPQADSPSCVNSWGDAGGRKAEKLSRLTCLVPECPSTFTFEETRTMHMARVHPNVNVAELKEASLQNGSDSNSNDSSGNEAQQFLKPARIPSNHAGVERTSRSKPATILTMFNPMSLKSENLNSGILRWDGFKFIRVPPPSECKICKKTFKNEDSLGIHNRKIHVERFTCKDCGKKFGFASGLKKHSLSHIAKLVKCKACGETFQSYFLLTEHRKEVHPLADDSDLEHICQECGKECKDKQALKNHKKCHSKRIYACSVCEKAFYSNTIMILHELTHSGKRYECASCDKNYMHEGSLKHHRRVSHPDEDLYKGLSRECPECGEVFKDHFRLQQHERAEHV